ncbi:hypothetical protein BCR32DRAFT_288595 [Anaeromyces robustus]|uniref:Uncharacterized protein n=1 Tax=Anaeromyces robustus TaxID=1754192 RepID=A0A1Y1UHM5_9FUNG|nr:hypothetical protein BCR32DRAFT_288595 [Anaeromyces robustus]|eukprot:ORX36974.1 hypothetical protein BCR32DRAFT_288595 [Anaeromyces robustus]
MKNGSHYLDDCITDNGIESLRKMHYLILSYAENATLPKLKFHHEGIEYIFYG